MVSTGPCTAVIASFFLADVVYRSVCKNDQACGGFRPSTRPGDGSQGDQDESDMTCYKGGLAVEENFQMCDVTSKCSSIPGIVGRH